MNTAKDKRTVLTLDAGGTNMRFSAIRGNEEIVVPITHPSNADNLDLCLNNIIVGFKQTMESLSEPPSAISFAFPGPADYTAGIIGNLGNLPAFRGGVPLGPILEDKFHLPVFINNDGDLFAYGEAIAGLLPEVNKALAEVDSPKRFKNLFGVTLGTGFGGGFVVNGELFIGDNAAGSEIWCMRSKLNPDCFVEENVSIRAIKREYARLAGISDNPDLTPKEIFNIAKSSDSANANAAIESFNLFGEAVGDALSNVCTLLDCLVVIGGGLSGAAELFLPAVIKEMNSNLFSLNGGSIPRFESKAFNLESDADFSAFIKGDSIKITVPGTNKNIPYDKMKRIGVGLSRLGTSKAVAIGAYAFALNELDKG